MVIGVDAIMEGNGKLVGCCATVNPALTQCLTKLYKQKAPKFTAEERLKFVGREFKEELERRITNDRSEIINEFICDAMTYYKKSNGALPQ